MLEPLFKAAIPEPYRIFGVRLLPLSLGRYRLLKRFGCAFVQEGEAQASIEDLLLGIFICAMRCQQFLELVEDERLLRREFRHWGKRIRKEIKADPHFNLFSKFGLFKAFVQEAAKIPQYWEESESQASSTAHWSHAVEVTLRSELGWTREEIEEQPLSKALADYFKWAEAQGLIRLIADEEIQMGEANAKVFEALAAATAAGTANGIGQVEEGGGI